MQIAACGKKRERPQGFLDRALPNGDGRKNRVEYNLSQDWKLATFGANAVSRQLRPLRRRLAKPGWL